MRIELEGKAVSNMVAAMISSRKTYSNRVDNVHMYNLHEVDPSLVSKNMY
jgi:hypothetical protein